MEPLPFTTAARREQLQGYVKITEDFVKAYLKMHPGTMTVPDAIDWFARHNTKLQAESPEVIADVKRQVTERVIPRVPES